MTQKLTETESKGDCCCCSPNIAIRQDWPAAVIGISPLTGYPEVMRPVSKLLGCDCLFFSLHKSYLTDDWNYATTTTVLRLCAFCPGQPG